MASKKNLARDRQLDRKKPTRASKKRFLIYCEGEATESDYFNDIRDEIRGALVELKVDSPSSDPLKLVRGATQRKLEAQRDAKRFKDEFLRFDEVWCVFDVDDHKTLEAARVEAQKADVAIAVSNPCFELWILLHFSDHSAYIETRDLPAKVRTHLPRYDKNLPDCSAIRSGRGDARSRAMRLAAMHDRNGSPGGNPSSDVWKLVDQIHRAAEPASAATA